MLYEPNSAELDVDELPDDFKELGEGLIYAAEMIAETRDFAMNLSKGNLDTGFPPRSNAIASDLKNLHSSLKHLTWQTTQVAKGDYSQRVSFLGEFADSFNLMIEQLKVRQEKLDAEMDMIKKGADELARSNSLLESIMGMMQEWIVMIDVETGEHLFANHPAENNLASLNFEKQLYDILFESAKKLNDDEKMISEEFPLLSDTAVQWFSLILYPLNWYGHKAVAAVLVDITTDREEKLELENVAYKDMMTGTYNRHFGMMLLDEWMAKKRQFSIIFVDMDRLKYVNDVFGHNEGDAYIKKVAETLKSFSPDVQVSRLGGDEFMLLVPGYEQKRAEEEMEALKAKLGDEELVSEDGSTTYHRSVSFGVVEFDPNCKTSSSDFLALADEKMYEYKKAHRAERRV